MATRILHVLLTRAQQNGMIFLRQGLSEQIKIMESSPGGTRIVKLVGVERPPIITIPEYREKFQIPNDEVVFIPKAGLKRDFASIVELTTKELVFTTKARKLETLIKDMIMRVVEQNIMHVNDSQEAIIRLGKQYSNHPDTVALGKGIAFPHLRCDLVAKPVLVIARSVRGIKLDSLDNLSIRLIFLLLVPTALYKDYLNWMAMIPKLFGEHQDENRLSLINVKNVDGLFEKLRIAEQIERLRVEMERLKLGR